MYDYDKYEEEERRRRKKRRLITSMLYLLLISLVFGLLVWMVTSRVGVEWNMEMWMYVVLINFVFLGVGYLICFYFIMKK